MGEGGRDEKVASSKRKTKLKTEVQKSIPYLWPNGGKMAKIDTQFMTKRLKNHTFWGCTYLYSPYEGVPPPPGGILRVTPNKIVVIIFLLNLYNYRYIYYMTNSVSGQDELNLALWLASRASKMELSCTLGIQAFSRKEKLSCFCVLSHIIIPLLTKLVQSRWLDMWPRSFFACLWTFRLGP